MAAYRTALLVTHVLAAIIGIGATFTFGVLGALQGRLGPAAGTALLEGQEAIEKRLVYPFALGLLPLTGALMIFARGWRVGFWSHWWLWVAIVIYLAAAGLSTGVLGPGLRRAIELVRGGHAGTPEFQRVVRVQQRVGPVTSVMAVVIIVLMVWKPGG